MRGPWSPIRQHPVQPNSDTPCRLTLIARDDIIAWSGVEYWCLLWDGRCPVPARFGWAEARLLYLDVRVSVPQSKYCLREDLERDHAK